jgi:hypothetical protein
MRIRGFAAACVVALAALGAAAATSAGAALPEAGQCLKVEKGKGAYASATCVKHAVPGRGSYEWTPVSATERRTFSTRPEEVSLATAGHKTIKCFNGTISGEYTGPKTALVQVELQGCLDSTNAPCQSGAPASTIHSLPLDSELGFIKNVEKSVIVGLDLKPQSPSTVLMAYECEDAPTETVRVEGSGIGKLSPIDRMTSEFDVAYKLGAGHAQLYQQFEGGSADTLTSSYMSGLETTSASSTLFVRRDLGSNGAALEIKALEL